MKTQALIATIEGIGLWAPGVPSWDAFNALRHGSAPAADAPAKPVPTLLPPNERRRAPDTVSVALHAAQAACAAAGRNPATLPSVFTSTYGDLAISDHLCQTLARAPEEVSPIRFHNSVHNAAAGYWTIGTGAMQPATALSAGEGSFALGLLEALTQLATGVEAVLLVGYDGTSTGLLRQVLHSDGLLSGALVLARDNGTCPRLSARWACDTIPSTPPVQVAPGNAMAPMLTLLSALSDGAATAMLPGGGGQALQIDITHG